jgi:hypothetical protein
VLLTGSLFKDCLLQDDTQRDQIGKNIAAWTIFIGVWAEFFQNIGQTILRLKICQYIHQILQRISLTKDINSLGRHFGRFFVQRWAICFSKRPVTLVTLNVSRTNSPLIGQSFRR